MVDSLSGGERRRVALARVLVSEPDLAILDEPTNHLDIATIEWLEAHLGQRFRGALLLITHDRQLLDRVATRTLDLEDGRLFSYTGGYAAYLEARAERLAHAERSERNRQNFLRREIEWLRRQPKARAGKQKARIGRAEEALGKSAPKQEQTADLSLDSERLGKTILELKDLQVTRGGQLCVDGLDLALAAGQRIGLVGPNGSGKTSLLLTLLGELEPSGGRVELGANTQIGYLDQARSGLEEGKSIREAVAGEISEIEIGGQTMQAGAYLERFLFDRRQQRLQVGELSGGERARVCLARLLWQKTNLLLLDEPTNDLDVATLGALEAMLIDYTGSALIVSHDRWFLDRVATHILAFEGEGRVVLHAGSYSQWREREAAREAGAARDARAGTSRAKGRSADNRAPSGGKKLTYAERIELDGLVERIEQAESVAEAIEARLADPAIYTSGGDQGASIRSELEAAQAEVTELTARWELLEEKKASSEPI
jgi:ATP-binding cassette subfamily F protein uup